MSVTFHTDDGYRFVVLPDGRVADSTDESRIDQSWPSVTEFVLSCIQDGAEFKVEVEKEGGTQCRSTL